MLIFKIVSRNILRQKRRSFLTFLLMTSGFVFLSLSIGIADGSFLNLIKLFTQNYTGHIQIHKKGYLENPCFYNTINSADKIEDKISCIKDVKASTPRSRFTALAFAGKKTTGVRVIGIDPEKEANVTTCKLKVTQGNYIANVPDKNIIISYNLAKVLNVKIRDQIVLIGQGADGSVANDIFIVSGILNDKSAGFGQMICYMHIKTAQEFASLYGRIHEIAVVLSDISKTKNTVLRIKKAINDSSYEVSPWQEIEKEFYKSMQADEKGRNLSFIIFMIVVAAGILDTVLMTILERTREFGLIRAIGARSSQVFKLIIYETLLITSASVTAGAVIGFIGNYIIMKYGISLSEPVFFAGVYLDRLVGTISHETLLIPAVFTFTTSLIVSVPPAFRAALLLPFEAMHKP